MSTLVELSDPAIDLRDDSVQALVFDPDPISRLGLGVLLRQQKWVSRCLLASEHEDAVAMVHRNKPDVAIVDVSKVAPFVAAYLAPLRKAHPAMPVVLSSRCPTSAAKQTPSAVGAVGMLAPGHGADEVIDMVHAALVGEETLTYHGLSARRPVDPLHNLSAREREVLALMSTGATNREIAAAIHIGPETVKKHAAALYRKLGVRNRTEAAQRALELLAAA